MLEQPPLSLYIHIPWCIKKCPYCDFNSHQAEGSLEEEKYTRKLYDDFLVELNRLSGQDRELQSIFIGGGSDIINLKVSLQSLESINSRLKVSAQILETMVEFEPLLQ